MSSTSKEEEEVCEKTFNIKDEKEGLGESIIQAYLTPSHPGSFSGLTSLSRVTGIKPSILEKYMNQERSFSLHRPVRKRMPQYRKYRAAFAKYQFQADLNDMSALVRFNRGNRYILTVIDVFSRYAWAAPMRSKTGVEMVTVFEKIFHDKGAPVNLQTDQGGEFFNAPFQTFLRDQQVNHFAAYSDVKACIVKRFNRTLKSKMYRYFTHKGVENWIDVLPDLVSSYNHTPHSSLPNGMTPAEAILPENEYTVWQYSSDKQKASKPKFQVGDLVRLSKKHGTFSKGYKQGWTRELFKVCEVDTRSHPVMYSVCDSSDEIIQGRFYASELQKIDKRS